MDPLNVRNPDESNQLPDPGSFPGAVDPSMLSDLRDRLERQDSLIEGLYARLDELDARIDEIVGLHSIPKRLLTLNDLANVAQKSARFFEQEIRRGHIRPIWLGGERRFTIEAFDAYLRENCLHKRGRRRR